MHLRLSYLYSESYLDESFERRHASLVSLFVLALARMATVATGRQINSFLFSEVSPPGIKTAYDIIAGNFERTLRLDDSTE